MAATTQKTPRTVQLLRQRRTAVITALLLVGLGYAAIPQLGFFDTNWHTLFESDWRLLIVALGCLLLSFAAATTIYRQLAPQPLRFGATYLVQIASAFAGKVLPVGLGSVSVNYLYLRRQGCRRAVAATVVAVNNLLGVVGHSLWLLVVAVLLSHQVAALSFGGPVNGWLVVGLVSGLGVFALLAIGLRSRFGRALKDIRRQLRSYRNQPSRLPRALLASMVLTACNIAIVWLSAQALAVPLGVVAAAVALTTSVLGQTVTPTPGGLGGVEAGLAGGLVLAGVTFQNAVLVTILYRFITYWLPLAFGGLALMAAVKRQLL